MQRRIHQNKRMRGRLRGHVAFCVFSGFILTGCSAKPSVVAIDLRKQVQTLTDENQSLKHDAEGLRANIKSLEASQTNIIPHLPQDRLDKLFTVHAVRLGKIAGGVELDPALAGDDGLKLHVIPQDEDGDDIKAAGGIEVEAFDLASATPLVGKWSYTIEQSRKLWEGSALMYEYVLTCPFTTRPQHEELTVKITFTDELTGQVWSTQKVIKVKLK